MNQNTTKDRLYVIKPGFKQEGQGPYYCPGCVEAAGLLEFFPALKAKVELRWVDFARPRAELVDLIGEANQSCPVLVLARPPTNLQTDVPVQTANGHAFVEGPR
ncbi:MAG: DUF3088 family protein, partial [Opitutaceae bacterium]|nr:DUF3088 family protein [Opitutaceae bacterium]